MNLDLSSVLFTSAANNGGHNSSFTAPAAYTGSDWKLTLKDSNDFAAGAAVTSGSTTLRAVYAAEALTIDHAALSTFAGSGYTNVTAALTDSSGKLLYYGSVNDDPAATSSTVTIPAGLTTGTYTLSLYGEDWNGANETDYASGTPFTTTVTVSPFAAVTGITMTSAAAVREDTNLTLTATAAPDTASDQTITWSVSDAGTTGATISGSTFRATAAGTAKVKASIANGTAIGTAFTEEFEITVTAAPVAPTYTISADTAALDFDSVQTGYTEPAAQIVTITNSGNQSITLTQPAAENYTIGAFSKTTLAASETATFTVQPKAGLGEGTYHETIAVQGANGGNTTNTVSIAADFTVNAPATSSGVWYDPPASYSITIPATAHGTVTVSPTSASRGTVVTLTAVPEDGYVLDTLTVTDQDGKELELTGEDGGRYTFLMPASKVTMKAVFKAAEPAKPAHSFTDIPSGAYYEDAVNWAVSAGITSGTGGGAFSPDAPCTRGQIVTFLWRAAGSPAPAGGANPFTDADAGSYYYDAMLWAAERGITSGTGADTFSPDDTCTRAQAMTFLWRAQGSPAAGTSNSFTDVASDTYYANAALWAAESGVTSGTGAAAFSPGSDCTRAQTVTFLYRCLGMRQMKLHGIAGAPAVGPGRVVPPYIAPRRSKN